MVGSKLYLDGCSFTYGLNLDPQHTLGHLFSVDGGYKVTNGSRNGKSNLAIAMDAYKNSQDHDVVVLGFTYSGRFYLKYQDYNVDFQPMKYMLPLEGDLSQALGQTYDEFHKYFYSLYQRPFCDDHSDFLIDSVASYILAQGKKLLIFSWEKRNVSTPIVYPYIPPSQLLPCGHFDKHGTRHLYNVLQVQLGENHDC